MNTNERNEKLKRIMELRSELFDIANQFAVNDEGIIGSEIHESCNFDNILSVKEAQEIAEIRSKTDVKTSYRRDQRKFAVNVLRLASISFEKIAYLNDTDLDILMKEAVRDVKP